MTAFENQPELLDKETEDWSSLEATTEELDNLLDKKLTVGGEDSQKEGSKQKPTRLPTPKRPVTQRRKSAESLTNNHIQENTNNNKPPPSFQSDPTPTSPGKRVRHSSIARLVKISTKERPAEAEKIAVNEDKKEQQCTRIPLLSNRHSMNISCLTGLETVESSKEIHHDPSPSKLKQPEIKVPESIKNMPKLQRRPTETFHEHIYTRERENSTKLTANLVSALGVITQPEENTEKPCDSPTGSHRFDKTHDRLQNLVDVRLSSEFEHRELITDDILEHDTDAMSAKDALDQYRSILSPFERTEIQRFPNIYFVGPQAKKIMASTDEIQQNFGYDDEKGDYHVRIKDHLSYRYEILESLGKGSFGQVLKCRDHKAAKSDPDNAIVAIKIIRNKKKFLTQAQTEVKILKQLVQWDPKSKYYNVRMLNSFQFRNHLCIVFECLSLNLYDILQQNGFQGFSINLVRRFAYQILTALKLLGEHNVIHCDLKPENILLKRPDRSGIRVIDYGSSCYTNEKVFTYIQSRFYRAPEVILGIDYGLPIDMWSTGCILAELYTGHPLFPGENEPDQLACIMQLLGPPKKEYLDRCSRKKQFFDSNDQARRSSNSKRKKRKPNSLSFHDALKRSTYDVCDKDFVDFISRCITWEPEKRIKPEEALNHPWIQAIKK